MFRLRIEGGKRAGETMPLNQGKVTSLGRGREADLRFPEDATMSRIQAEMAFEGGGWVLRNKSQHGTLVSGVRVDTEKRLQPGEILTLGGTNLVFEPDPSGAATVAPGAPQPEGAAAGGPKTPPPGEALPEGAQTQTPAGAAAAALDPKKKKNTTLIIILVVTLFGCCCFGNIFWFVIYPMIRAA